MSTPNRATAAGSERTTLNGLTEKALFDRLNLPFDVEDIKWKPQTVDYRKKTAMAVAHADPRAYIDRLNEVVGIGGWESHLELSNSPFNKFIRGKKAYGSNPATEDKQIPGNKVYCVCSVTIEGIGTHTSTGDSDASDENAATSAEAQAFKRACMQFGLGRYLYDLPKLVVPYDQDKGGFTETPRLPDWAIPPVKCTDCGKQILTTEYEGKEYSTAQLIENSVKKYGTKLCLDDQRKRSAAVKTAAGGRLDK